MSRIDTDESESEGLPGEDDPLHRWAERLRSQPATSTTAKSRRPIPERPRTVAEAAEELGLSVHTVRAWVAARRIGHLRLGRAIRIPASEIRRVIDKNTIPAIKE